MDDDTLLISMGCLRLVMEHPFLQGISFNLELAMMSFPWCFVVTESPRHCQSFFPTVDKVMHFGGLKQFNAGGLEFSVCRNLLLLLRAGNRGGCSYRLLLSFFELFVACNLRFVLFRFVLRFPHNQPKIPAVFVSPEVEL